VDQTPIVARLSVIADSVSALQGMQDVTLEEFIADGILHTAAEHYFQVAIQAALEDLERFAQYITEHIAKMRPAR
jgi:uncharacterized protein YutE (UPF0331/DUF86 family)